MLGFWHVHAADYAREAVAHPDTEIVAAWDEDVTRGATARGRARGPAREDLRRAPGPIGHRRRHRHDQTSAHPEVITAAAEAGKHVFTEKVLALTPAEAQGIVEAIERAGVTLTVSLPRLTHGYTLAIRDVLASGRFGR